MRHGVDSLPAGKVVELPLATLLDLRTPLPVDGSKLAAARAYARVAWFEPTHPPLFRHECVRPSPGTTCWPRTPRTRWQAVCLACGWVGACMRAGAHAREDHGAIAVDLNTPGVLQRWRSRVALPPPPPPVRDPSVPVARPRRSVPPSPSPSER